MRRSTFSPVEQNAGLPAAGADPTGSSGVNNSYFFVEVDDGRVQEKQGYTWKELQVIEAHRRDILKRSELGFWQILRYWDGTCLGLLSREPLFWFTLGIYALIRTQVRFGDLPAYVANIGEASNVDILGGFLSFLLVFFVNQSNNRFNQSFKHSTDCTRYILDVAGICATALPEPNALRLVRYLNASHVAGYVGLSHTYTKQEFFDKLNARFKLLTDRELVRIEQCDMDHAGDSFHEITNWALMEVQRAENEKLIDARMAGSIRDKILNYRAAMDSIYDYTGQPIHFFYIHFLSLLTAVYLPIFAISSSYSAGAADQVHWSTDLLCGLIVGLQAIFVIGLRLLGQKMLDPFGDDAEDLSVLFYVKETWKASNRILSSQFPEPVSQEEEEQIRCSSASLGYPWDLRQRRQQPIV